MAPQKPKQEIPKPLGSPNPPPSPSASAIPAPTPPKATVAPTERNFGGTREIMVDRYRLSVEKCAKNRALKKDMIDLAFVEHRHFWDTKDRRGKLMTHTEFACGHKHALTYTMDGNGEPIIASVACGPALQEVQTVNGRGRRTSRLVPINFGLNPDKADAEDVKDVHMHTVEYIKSEKMTIKV